jgi:cell division protein FtsL
MTIYTQNASELYSDTNEYMDVVSTTLYKIVSETKRIINEFFSNIDKIYITGLGTCINNVDLFFQEYISSAKCEILKPYFLNTSSMQIPIKEYIEVNSAIALALDGLGMVNKEVNFSKSTKMSGISKENSKLSSVMNAQIDFGTIKQIFSDFGKKLKKDFIAPLDSTEKLLLRGATACIITAVLFIVFSNIISKQLEEKTAEVEDRISKTNTELSKVDSDINIISARNKTYEDLIQEITNPTVEEEDETTTSQRVIQKDSIPNFLNRVMFVIPKKVKLISIQNTTSDHIVINAEAEKYEQLGYFKAVLSTNGILENVKSTSGEKTGSTVQVTIEGDLP